ncbi:MAG: SMP-30/gluconolactonase/LRE family protein [Flavobacteriaceae bacterium]|nr:SMP-30/gluconolactonase/LRE family protein [Flavobacteriaceae bacterium]
MRLTKKILLIVLVLIIAFIANILISTGFFRTVENKFEGDIVKKIALPGAEDITVSTIDGFALISSTNRGIFPPTENEVGGLYLMDLKKGTFNVKPLTSNFKKSFAPHGISMFKKDSTYKVMAINHTLKGHSIEVFTLNGETLTFEKTLTDDSMVSPNDIVLLDENRFYFTNDHKYTEGIGRFIEDYAGLSISNVIYFDGENYIEVAKGIAYANGINFDANRNLLFVASPRKFLIKVYSKNTDGSLAFIEDIPCGTGVDNIEFDTEGNLWVGAHPNLLRFASYAKGKKDTSPSEIIKIEYKGKNDYTIETIYLDDGKAMSASTVAAPFGNLILTGNVMDDEFLILKKK